METITEVRSEATAAVRGWGPQVLSDSCNIDLVTKEPRKLDIDALGKHLLSNTTHFFLHSLCEVPLS